MRNVELILLFVVLQVFSALSVRCISRAGTMGICRHISQCTTKDPSRLSICGKTGLHCCTPNSQEDWVLDNCGESPMYNVGDLKNWTSIEYDEYSWLASLEYGDSEKGSSVCSGSVISSSYVLTAAHCVEENFVANLGGLIGVRLADYQSSHECDYGTIACPHYQRYGISKTIFYPTFGIGKDGRINDNIALLKLVRKIEFDNMMKPICLPFGRPAIDANSSMIISGWGPTAIRRGKSIKRAAQVELEKCASNHRYTNQFCVKTSRERTCNGDLGGPLMYKSRGNIMILEGIATECNDLGQAGTFIKVRHYEEWIRRTIRT